MPVLRAILHDRYTWEVHVIAMVFALLVLLFALIPGVTVIMVLPTAFALAAVVVLSFWLHPVTYRNRGVADADGPDRVESDRVGAVQVLDPRLEVVTARRNGMGVPVHSYDNGGLIGRARPVLNDTGRPIRIFSPAQCRRLREVLVPTKDDPFFLIGSPHYAEAIRILGARGRWIRRESIRQINGRYLKADQYVRDADGWLVITNDHEPLTESVRIRIPRDSWLRKDFTHSKR